MAERTGRPGIGETFRDLPLAGRCLLLGVFVNQLGAFLQIFMVLYLTARGFTAGQAGLAVGGYAVGAIAGTLAGGTLTDRLGPRATIVLAMAAAAVFTVTVTGLHSIGAVIPVVALAGAMTQASRPASAALLQSMVPADRQVMMQAMFRTALNAGQVLGPLAAAWLSLISWNLVFWADAGTSLAYCLIAVALLRPGSPGLAATGSGEPAGGTASGSYLAVLRDGRYLAYLALMLGNGIVYIQLFVVLPLMLKAGGYPAWGYGTLMVVSAVIVVAFSLPATKITQGWPLWVAVTGGWSLMVAGSGLIGLAGGFAVVVAAIVLVAAGQTIGGPGAFAHPALAAPPGAAGRYLGSAFAVFGLGQAIGPVLGVALYARLGAGFWGVVLVFGAALVVPGVWGMRLPPSAVARAGSREQTPPGGELTQASSAEG